MNKTDFIGKLTNGRANWDALIARIPEELMIVQGVGGGEWTIKDLIAHNNWNELEMVRMLQQRDLYTGSDVPWELSNDDRNRILFERDRDLPFETVLADDSELREVLLNEAAKLEDADLNDPGKFAHMPPDWVPWQIIAGCTFNHYPEHIEVIENWLSETEGRKA
jgi:hypothetical protein